MNLPSKVRIREVALRDGFQSWPEFVPTETKVKVVESLICAGITNIETTSFVSPKAIPQMRDAADLMARVPRDGCRHDALVPNLKGAQLAASAGVDGILVVISASEPHNMANLRRTIDQSLSDLDAIYQVAGDHEIEVLGVSAVAFGCPYQGDVPVKDVLHLLEAYISRGSKLVLLGDTTGMATPVRVERMVKEIQDRYPATELGLHFHNNRGTAMANLYAALKVGVTTFDTALGGIGGCPNVPQAAGNLPTEDVVFMLEDMGIDTGINLATLIKASLNMETALGKTLPGQVMKSGPRSPELAAQLCGITH